MHYRGKEVADDAEDARLHPAATNNVAEYSLPETGVESVAPMNTADADDLPAVPGYRLVRELGRGAMGKCTRRPTSA